MLWMFVSAGISKLAPANREFYQSVFDSYGVKHAGIARISTWSLGSMELLAGVLTVLPESRALGAAACVVLLSVYMLAMANQIRQGKLDADCGCTGPGGGVAISPVLLIRNGVLIGLLILVFLVDASFLGRPEVEHWLLPSLLAVMFILISVCAEQLLASAQKLKRLRYVR